jgi:hypothetical protein
MTLEEAQSWVPYFFEKLDEVAPAAVEYDGSPYDNAWDDLADVVRHIVSLGGEYPADAEFYLGTDVTK